MSVIAKRFAISAWVRLQPRAAEDLSYFHSPDVDVRMIDVSDSGSFTQRQYVTSILTNSKSFL